MRFELMEKDTVCDGIVAVETDLFVPSCTTWTSAWSVKLYRDTILALYPASHAGPFIGCVLRMIDSFRCRLQTRSL